MDAFMTDVLNVKPVLLKQKAPEMDAFQQKLLNSQRETYFLLKPDAPRTNAFHVKDVVMKDVLNVKPVLLKQNSLQMDAFQQRLFNSQRETYFLFKPDAPRTNAFHVKDVVNIEPFLFDTMLPKMDAFTKDVLNVKPVLLKQNAPEMDAFQQRLFNSQRETYFLLKPDAPKTNAFHVKDVVNIEPFLFDKMPQKWKPL